MAHTTYYILLCDTVCPVFVPVVGRERQVNGKHIMDHVMETWIMLQVYIALTGTCLKEKNQWKRHWTLKHQWHESGNQL